MRAVLVHGSFKVRFPGVQFLLAFAGKAVYNNYVPRIRHRRQFALLIEQKGET